jgi:hypothetical protein
VKDGGFGAKIWVEAVKTGEIDEQKQILLTNFNF